MNLSVFASSPLKVWGSCPSNGLSYLPAGIHKAYASCGNGTHGGGGEGSLTEGISVDNMRCPACGEAKETMEHFILRCLNYAYK